MIDKKMNKKIRDKLCTMTNQELVEVIDKLSTIDGVIEFLEFEYLSTVKDKIKSVAKIFNKYKRRTKFHDYYQTIEFYNLLTTEVLNPIEQRLIEIAPYESAGLLQEIIDSFEKLIESKDDSSGCAMDFLYSTAKLWGNAWSCIPDRNIEELVQLVYKYHTEHQYLHYNELFIYFKKALTNRGLELLEEYLKNDDSALLIVIELQNDVDKYIKIGSQIKSFNNTHKLRIAEMLLDDLRSADTIKWLNDIHISPTEQDYRKCQDLLIQAYANEGKSINSQNVRQETFLNTISPKYYLDYVKHADDLEKAKFKQIAMTHVLNLSNESSITEKLVFLETVEEYEVLEEFIIKNLDKLTEYNYSYYRKLSKALALRGRYLPACLLRRYLIDSVLAKSVSKYYDYAVSDLKLSVEFGRHVTQWKNFNNNEEYINNIKIMHKKKSSFWGKIQFA